MTSDTRIAQPPADARENNLASASAVAVFLGTTVFGLAIDLWTKYLAVTHLKAPSSDLPPGQLLFIPGWLHFTYTENHGAVFGLGQGHRWFFVLVSIGAIILLTRMFAHSGKSRAAHLVLGMLLAGVLGNMYDRIVHGFVRDMIHALPGWRYPDFLRNAFDRGSPMGKFFNGEIFPWVFNIADTLLCVGVALVMLHAILTPAAPAQSKADAKDAHA